jgi:hypothetical protein
MKSRTSKRTMQRVDVTPTTDMLHSYRNSNLTALLCFGELIDNCIDAEATLIEIDIDPRAKGQGVVVVKDNGNGMVNAAKAFQPGRHVATGKDQGSSRYGIGLKDAAFRLGERVVIDSVRDDKRSKAIADVGAMMNSGRWEVLLRRWTNTKSPRGTIVTISMVDFQINPQNVARLKTELEKIYATAIRAGRTIVVNGCELEKTPAVKLRGERILEGDIDGKRFRVRGGFVVAGQPPVSNGVTVRLPYRVICSGERLGFEKYDVSDFWAEVELIEDKSDRSTWWRVTKNKDSLHEKSDICRWVVEKFGDMLKRYTPNHVITIPIPKAPKSEDQEDLVVAEEGGIASSPGDGPVLFPGVEFNEGDGGEHGDAGVVDEAGKSRANPKKKRGYELNVRMEADRCEAIVEARVGEKSATVLLGDLSPVWNHYTPGRDNGALRDCMAFVAIAAGLVFRPEDEPKTPLDSLIDQSSKVTERLHKTLDNLLTQCQPPSRGNDDIGR